MCYTTLPTAWISITADNTAMTQSLLTAFLARSLPLSARRDRRVWIAIAADNTTTLVAIDTCSFFCTYFIAVFVQFPPLIIRLYLCSDGGPALWGSDMRGSTLKFLVPKTTMRTNLAKPEVTLLGLLLRLYNTVDNVQDWKLETVDLRWQSCHNSVWGGFPKCLQVLH